MEAMVGMVVLGSGRTAWGIPTSFAKKPGSDFPAEVPTITRPSCTFEGSIILI